jgi:hypothetical protein
MDSKARILEIQSETVENMLRTGILTAPARLL